MLPVVSLSLLMIPLSTLSVMWHLICINNYGWLLNLNLTNKTLQTGARSSLLISILSFEQPNNSTAINAKTDACVLEEKSSFNLVVNLSPFYRYNFGRCSSELNDLVPLPHFCGKSTRYSNSLHAFSVTLDVIRMSMSTVSLASGVIYLQGAFYEL